VYHRPGGTKFRHACPSSMLACPRCKSRRGRLVAAKVGRDRTSLAKLGSRHGGRHLLHGRVRRRSPRTGIGHRSRKECGTEVQVTVGPLTETRKGRCQWRRRSLGGSRLWGLLHGGVLDSSCKGGRSLVQGPSRRHDWTSGLLASPQWRQWMLGFLGPSQRRSLCGNWKVQLAQEILGASGSDDVILKLKARYPSSC
jgi:hypothetical protein